MKLYVSTKTLTLEDGDHELILFAHNKKFDGYDFLVESKEIKVEDNKFIVREQDTWDSFPLYEVINGELVDFDYSNYEYFTNAQRRNRIARKINKQFNRPAEAKIVRKTLKYIMDTLDIEYPDFFRKYNKKVEDIINRNPKEGGK